MWYLPWPASSPTSSLTTSYYLIHCGLDDDNILATHTRTRAQICTCPQMQPIHLTAGVFFYKKKWSVGLLCFFSPSSLGTKTETHVVSHRSVSCWSIREDSVLCWRWCRPTSGAAYWQGSGQKYKREHRCNWQTSARSLSRSKRQTALPLTWTDKHPNVCLLLKTPSCARSQLFCTNTRQLRHKFMHLSVSLSRSTSNTFVTTMY